MIDQHNLGHSPRISIREKLNDLLSEQRVKNVHLSSHELTHTAHPYLRDLVHRCYRSYRLAGTILGLNLK